LGAGESVWGRGDIHVARTIRIWHRNYYEEIVRTEEAHRRIAEYIRINPWRCVMDLGSGLRGMGNPTLWFAERMGVLCSRNAPRPKGIPEAEVYLGGFHSPMEKAIFEELLACKKAVIWCPAWGLERLAFAPGVREALEENRLLILEMRNREGNLAAADERNRFVLEAADALWLPHVSPRGNLSQQVAELDVAEKIIDAADTHVRATRMSPSMSPTPGDQSRAEPPTTTRA